MPITLYTEDELREMYLAQVRTLVDGADTSPFSDYDLQGRAIAAIAAGEQSHAASILRQRFPRDCDDSELAAHGADRGLYYLAPTKARGYIAITGNAGDVQPAGSVFSLGALTWTSTADAAIPMPSFSSTVILEGSTRDRLLVADSSGLSAGSVILVGSQIAAVKGVPASGILDLHVALPLAPYVGETVTQVTGALVEVEADAAGGTYNRRGIGVTLASPVGGISASADLILTSGGADAETAPEFRQRIVAFDAAPPAGTNVGAIEALALAYPDARIGAAFVFPNFQYPGRTKVIAYGPPGARELSTLTTDDLEAFLVSALGNDVDLTVEPMTYGTAAGIDVTATTGTGYEPDWGDSTTSAFVIGVGSTEVRVELTSSPVGKIPVGARVLVPVAVGDGWRTEQRKVSGVDASGIDLDTRLSGLPVSGEDVTSGSPAASAMLGALSALFDALGPGTYVSSASKERVRWPAPSTRYGAIVSSSLVLSRLATVEGLVDVVWTSGSFSTIIPAALETVRLGIVTLRYTYP